MISERPRQFFFICLLAFFVLVYLILYHVESKNHWDNTITPIEFSDTTDSWLSTSTGAFDENESYDDRKSAHDVLVIESDTKTPENPNKSENLILLEDIDEADIHPWTNESSRQIFFIETSHPEGANLELNERKACAIESAAYMHPNYKIYVIIAGNTTIDLNSDKSNTYKNLVTHYPNVFFRSLDPFEFMRDTPLQNFHKWRQLKGSKNYNVYLADILRLVALYRYGGLYFDTDVVVLKNFEDLGENYLCQASYYLLMSGTMQFSSEGFGHEVVGAFLKNAVNEFNAREWASNGPSLVTRVMKRICKARNTKEMNVETCNGIKILSKTAFLPIDYKKHMWYFQPKWAAATVIKVRNSYTAHIFNHMNGHLKLKTSEGAGYLRLAEKYCPIVYENLGEYF